MPAPLIASCSMPCSESWCLDEGTGRILRQSEQTAHGASNPRPGGLTLVVFESGAECYYDDYDDALDVLSKAGYTDKIVEKEEKS